MKFDAFPVELIDRFVVRLDAIFPSGDGFLAGSLQEHDPESLRDAGDGADEWCGPAAAAKATRLREASSIYCCDPSFRDASRWILRFPDDQSCRISVSAPREARHLAELVRENETIFPLLTVFDPQQAELKLLHFASRIAGLDEPFLLHPESADQQKADSGDNPDSGKRNRRFQNDFQFSHADGLYVFLLPNRSSSSCSSPCWLYCGDGFRPISLSDNQARLTFNPEHKPKPPLSRELRALIPIKVPQGIQIGDGSEDAKASFAIWSHFLRSLNMDRTDPIQGGNASGYWKVWRRYLAVEKRNLFFALRKKGWLPFHEPRPAGTGSDLWVVSLNGPISEEARKELQTATPNKHLRLVFWKTRPSFLSVETRDVEPTLDELFKPYDSREIKEQTCEVTGFDENQLILTLTKRPPDSGGFSFDCEGDLIQWNRKQNVLEAILCGASINPRIAKLFTGAELSRAVPQNIPWSSAETKEMLRSKHRELNESQKAAISVALNTPDIALIQGPPGTGKTTVVSVLLQRLFERFRSEGHRSGSDRFSGRVLLSGFQHDAVENLVDHADLMGIPVPKFGKRHKDGSEGENIGNDDPEDVNADSFRKSVDKWRQSLCKTLEKTLEMRNPHFLRAFEQRDWLRALLDAYRKGPSETTASALLAAIRDSQDLSDNSDITEEAETLLAEWTHHRDLRASRSGSDLRRQVWNLRTTPEGFADDGPDRAFDVAEAFQGELESPDAEILKRASLLSRGRVPDDPTLLQNLSEIRRRLLAFLLDSPVFAIERTDQRVLRSAEKAEMHLRTSKASDPVFDTVYRFWRRLRDDPYGVMDSICEYSFAFAATCLQSVNPKIVQQKGGSKEEARQGDFKPYDYVIIDEAARPTALDLLVAAVQGKRVVLVGDQNQLGAMTDEDILKILQSDEDDGDETPEEHDDAIVALRESFFEWLLKPLKQIERQDGIRRFAMLNEQYRMHPVLGEFISRQFYKGELSSPRPANVFSHNLSGTGGHPAIWLDVRIGACKPDGTSFSRASEADAILEKIVEWNDFHGTIGVISFYKAQADCIQDRLTEFFDGKLPDKIQVGTVDAFQGREFDIVFLSVVRIPAGARGNHPFGHLESSNRLNVAMSRQKRLLVVVGHSGLLDLPDAKDKIPALVEFKKLCDRLAGEGGRQ